MLYYPAIWRTDQIVDSMALLSEFEELLAEQLCEVYPLNNSWTGITVFSGKKDNRIIHLPKLTRFIEQFGWNNLVSVTYFNLAPDSNLHRHRDMNGNLLFGVIRLHIPLKTNPKAIMEVQKIPYHMPINTMWALDTSGLHALVNGGEESRIHLVIDIKYGKETAKYFPRMSFAILLHLTQFILIVIVKLFRDVLTKPHSLLLRSRAIFSRIFGK